MLLLLGALITVVAGVLAAIAAEWYKARWGQDARLRLPPSETLMVHVRTRLQVVKERGYIRCGLIHHPPLCDFLVKRDGTETEAVGIYGSLARIMELNSGISFRFQAVDWYDLANVFSTPETGLDLVLSVFETSARQRYAEFVAPLFTVTMGGIARAESSYLDPSSLASQNATVVVCEGEAGWEITTRYLQIPRSNVIVTKHHDITRMMGLVISGEADVAIADNVSGKNYIRTRQIHSDHILLKQVFVEHPLYIYNNAAMVPPNDSEWSHWVDFHIRSAARDPDFRRETELMLAEYAGIVQRLV